MKIYFSIFIEGVQFDLITMDTRKPILFQVFTDVPGRRRMFHFLANADGNLVFTNPESCPPQILVLQDELSAAVLQKFKEDWQ